jgi:hypothetical protein
MHELRVSKSSGVIIKLDFEKANDKVNGIGTFWRRSYLEKALLIPGFSGLIRL